MAGNLLWAHLLRKNATTTDSLPQLPPLAPQDKTGTSMRMLIHDTQVNLEKFSSRLDGLLQRVEDCRAQVVNANKLLDVERDKLLSEILEIANRSQSEIKAHIGTPAQVPALDLVRVAQVSTENSVQALEKRIDALQALLQTHGHAMQSIQDQQNTLIGAVMPLVPIIHSVPPQIDQIKAALSEMVVNAVSTTTAGCSTRIGSSVSGSRRKRSNTSVPGPSEMDAPVSSPLDSHKGPHLSLKRARIEGATHHAGKVQLPRKLTRLTVPPTNSRTRLLLRTPQTPRQPLADLLLLPGSNISGIQRRTTRYMDSTSRGYMRPLDTLPIAGGPLTTPTPMSGPSLRPLEHVPPDLLDQTITRRHSATLLNVDSTANNGAAGPSDQDALSKAIKIEDILEPNLTGIFSIHSSPLSSLPSSITRRDPNETGVHEVLEVEPDHVPLPSSEPFSNPDASPSKSMSLRDRRAQISRFGRRETRRFIPLVPWSDEEA